jgi:hypothetical protein
MVIAMRRPAMTAKNSPVCQVHAIQLKPIGASVS